MKELVDDLKKFWNCKLYVAGLALTVLCAYGFAVTHNAIGMDDTAVSLYFEEGLAPYVGRWSLFLLNKLFSISDFAPWMVEVISVLIFMVSVTLWCIMWKRVCEPKVVLPVWSYVFVAGIFISCPLISEVFVFYLHNGICTGYGITAAALLVLLQSMSVGRHRSYRIKQLIYAAVLLGIALGFYESFVIVYIIGAVMCFFLIRRLYGKAGEGINAKLPVWIGTGVITILGSVLIRFIVLELLNKVYQFERLESYNVQYRKLFGDIFTVEGEFIMILKRFVMKYYINAIVYLPITVLVVSLILIGIYSICCGISKKDILLPVCSIVIVVLPVLMSLVEGLATRYRSAQYVPIVGAFAVLLILIEFRLCKLPGRFAAFSYILMGILIYNQCADTNYWFYLDDLKYQNAKEVMDQIAYDLEKDYDVSKPIVFRGAYTVPKSISEDASVSFSSEEYQWIARLTDPVDTHLKEKYFLENGSAYVFAESPLISTLQWGVTAFDGTSQQLINFWKMHGHDSFTCESNLDVIEEAEQVRAQENMPGYPKQGYIKECDEYIIVNFSDVQ